MARIDKYDPISGGFRAPLNADTVKTSGAIGAGATAPFGVGLNTSGRVVVGAGNTGVLGVLVLDRAYKAGEIVDVMTDGEITEAGGTAGTVYYAATADGVISTTNTGVRIGFTVEAGRLVVRMKHTGGAA